jgi:Rrf2 family iron-sulfur cluster assembly transcriptional regulator
VFSSTTGYAIRAVIYIAEHEASGLVSGGAVAAALDAPVNYLAKTLHGLVRAGLLESTRGKGGGFCLVDPADTVSLLAVASVFDRIDEHPRCLLGRPQCRDDQPCAMHERWKPLAEGFAAFLRDTTVADLMSPADMSPE